MPAASILIKPASANCNMDCKYCFYKCLSSHREEYSKGFMKEETLETLVREAIAYADGSLTFAFQGGEPTLAGLDFFQKAVELQQKYNNKKLQIENTIQTNGLLIDEKWARFLGEHRFLVGLSLDGPKKMHDRYRKDAGGQDTFGRIMNSVQLLEQYHVDYNVVTVATIIRLCSLFRAWMRSNGRMGHRSAAFMRWNRSSMENFCASCLICGMRILPQGRRWISVCFPIWHRWRQDIRQRNVE